MSTISLTYCANVRPFYQKSLKLFLDWELNFGPHACQPFEILWVVHLQGFRKYCVGVFWDFVVNRSCLTFSSDIFYAVICFLISSWQGHVFIILYGVLWKKWSQSLYSQFLLKESVDCNYWRLCANYFGMLWLTGWVEDKKNCLKMTVPLK